MFQVKICGVTTAADARMVAAAGADCIGLNFVPGSPRFLDLDAALAVADAVPDHVLLVGVFAGSPVEEIARTARALGLDAVQLHGHVTAGSGPVDPPERCVELAPLPVIRAVRLEPETFADRLASARAWVSQAAAAGRLPVAVLVDATAPRTASPGVLGGTGERVDWPALARVESLQVPLALAGGLTPENVAEAVRTTGLGAVDAASGVEAGPGRKDPGKVAAFVAAARRALAGR